MCNAISTAAPIICPSASAEWTQPCTSPNTVMATPTSANSVQAGASEDASHQPPIATVSSLTVEASTGPMTFAAPCEAK